MFANPVLQSARPLPLTPTVPAFLAAAPALPLPSFMKDQEHSNWCWTAVATSVGLLFGTGQWTQCDTATSCLPNQDCCKAPGPCNVYGPLDAALSHTKSLAGPERAGRADPTIFEPELDAGHPVCVRVAWFAGGAHFLAITGYDDPGTVNDQIMLDLQDPEFGPSRILLGYFPQAYRTVGGDWTYFYLTAPQP